MTTRIRIQPNYYINGISLTIADQSPGHVRILGPGGRDAEVITDLQVDYSGEPTLVVSDDHGRALLDALSDHYRGTSEGRSLRADYEHERGRVDQFIKHLLGNPQ